MIVMNDGEPQTKHETFVQIRKKGGKCTNAWMATPSFPLPIEMSIPEMMIVII